MPVVAKMIEDVRPGDRVMHLRGVRVLSAGAANIRVEFTDGGWLDFQPGASLVVEVDPPGTPEELNGWTKDQLLAEAERMGVAVRASDTKAIIIEALTT